MASETYRKRINFSPDFCGVESCDICFKTVVGIKGEKEVDRDVYRPSEYAQEYDAQEYDRIRQRQMERQIEDRLNRQKESFSQRKNTFNAKKKDKAIRMADMMVKEMRDKLEASKSKGAPKALTNPFTSVTNGTRTTFTKSDQPLTNVEKKVEPVIQASTPTVNWTNPFTAAPVAATLIETKTVVDTPKPTIKQETKPTKEIKPIPASWRNPFAAKTPEPSIGQAKPEPELVAIAVKDVSFADLLAKPIKPTEDTITFKKDLNLIPEEIQQMAMLFKQIGENK
jgi:hypothetical protein